MFPFEFHRKKEVFTFWVNYSFKYSELHISCSIVGDRVKGYRTMVNRICWLYTQSWLAFKSWQWQHEASGSLVFQMPYCYHSDYCLWRFWRTTRVCSRILCSSCLRLSTTHSCSRRDRFASCLSCDSCTNGKTQAVSGFISLIRHRQH